MHLFSPPYVLHILPHLILLDLNFRQTSVEVSAE
jgi:hypothetical protein